MKYSANDNLEVMRHAKNYNNFLINCVEKIIKKYKCKNILDFGCSDGFFIKKILDRIENIDICGVECDEDSILNCVKSNIQVKKSIGEYDKKFDFIYSFNVLEHIEDDILELKKFNGALNDNAKLLLYLPAMRFLYSSMDEKVGHYRRYNKKDIEKKLKLANFKVDEIKYCDCIGVLATLLYKLKDKIKKNNGDINILQIKIFDIIFPFGLLLDKIVFSRFLGKNLLIFATKI